MVDAFLVILCLALSVTTLIGSVYMVVHLSHPDDKNEALAPKIVCVLGLWLACLTVLLLPLDVGNRSVNGGFDMPTLWLVCVIAICVFALFIFPFTIFYYEEASDGRSPIKTAIFYSVMSFGISLIIFGILYAVVGFSDLPVNDLTSGLVPYDGLDGPKSCPALDNGRDCRSRKFTLEIRVSFAVYIIAMLSIVGWVFLVLFGAVGMASTPLSLINAYRFRPKRLELDEYARKKIELHNRSAELLKIGEVLKKEEMNAGGKRSRKLQKNFNRFKGAVVSLEDDFDRLMTAYKERGGNPIKYWAYLFFGIISLSLSISWVLHILLYMLPPDPVDPFLNTLLIDLDEAFSLFGVLAFAFYSFYLLVCVLKGIIGVGLRFFFIEIHPIKINGTYINSLLFNIGVLLLCAVAVIQLCSDAFRDYARLTAADLLFGTQTRTLRGFSHFFIYFHSAFIGVFFLTALVMLVRPSDPGKKALESLK